MWCYQKPGFEALLLAELQRQQQCRQFCDTLLKAEGVSVPAHSCVLSALSPQVSSSLSSMPAPPAGQSRLLEFQTLGACALLHVVRLLYSGEMAGEGEAERREAVSAAATLGIHGLVEVTERSGGGERGGARHAEVGVQTEPPALEESEGRRWRWRREVRDGSTVLWKETLSVVEKDVWTQTEEPEGNAAPLAPSFETTDVAALLGIGQTDSHLVPPQIPCIPISFVYPPEENQPPPTASAASMQDSTTTAGHAPVAAPHTSTPRPPPPLSTQTSVCSADPQGWWPDPKGAEGEEWEDEGLAHFQGNIPGFISYFLNSDEGEGPRRGRGRPRGRPRGRRGRPRGRRRAGTGERRARRPWGARAGGRGRGGLTQTVDVQDVGASRLQKLFPQRWGMRTPRTSQGGGAAGRRLHLKTRDLLTPARSSQRKRSGKVWELSQSGDLLLQSEGGRRGAARQVKQDSLPRAESATPASLPSPPPVHFYTIHALPMSSPPLSPALLPPAASYVSPAPSLLHTTPLPPPPDDQPEHIDRLLEEVMMGLDILPNGSGAANPQPALPLAVSSRRSYAPSGGNVAQNEQGGPGLHGPAQVLPAAKNSEAPVLQVQGEGELNDMLDRFLQSFERHVDNCGVRAEREGGGASAAQTGKPYTALSEYRKPKTDTTPPHPPHPQSTHAPRPVKRHRTRTRKTPPAPQHAEGTPESIEAQTRRPGKRRKGQYRLSLERKSKSKKAAPKAGVPPACGDEQLQKMPVVKLKRSGPLPARVTLQGHSCQSLDVKSPAKIQSSSARRPGGSPEKGQSAWLAVKTYPIRSRLKEAQMVVGVLSSEEPPVDERPPPAGPPGPGQVGPKASGRLLGSSQPAEPRGTEERLKENLERRQEEPQEDAEGAARRGKRRGAESGEETGGDASPAKRLCSERTAPPTSETRTTDTEDVIDVETVSPTGLGECVKEEAEAAWGEMAPRGTDEETEGSGDEIIDVDGDAGGASLAPPPPPASPPPRPAAGVSAGSTGSWEDEDVDVMGGSSPEQNPVTISWPSDAEEEEEEEEEERDGDLDVVGEKADSAAAAPGTASRGELGVRKYQAEVLLH